MTCYLLIINMNLLNLESWILHKPLTEPKFIYPILKTRSEDTKQDKIVLPNIFISN